MIACSAVACPATVPGRGPALPADWNTATPAATTRLIKREVASVPSLGFEERFAYEANVGQLCAIDTITVIQGGAVGRGPRCPLGQFVPVRYVEETASGD